MTKAEEYQNCKVRGHKNDGTVLASNPPKSRCQFCGTVYWYTTEMHETDIPA